MENNRFVAAMNDPSCDKRQVVTLARMFAALDTSIAPYAQLMTCLRFHDSNSGEKLMKLLSSEHFSWAHTPDGLRRIAGDADAFLMRFR